jgi:hypothetical protein
LLGHNSTLRQHCRIHYEIYRCKCEEADIPINHHAIPPKLAKLLEKVEKAKSQTTLDDIVAKRPDTFMRDGILHAIAQFVACNAQVSK